MSDHNTVDVGESGRLRLYTLDTETAEGAALRTALVQSSSEAGPLAAQALGATGIDPYWLTLVPISDVKSIGFETYLRSGHDVPDAQIAAAKEQLEGATGTMLIVQSPAFAGTAQTLSPAPYLAPLAEFDTIREPGTAHLTQRADTPGPASAPESPKKPRRAVHPLAALAALVVAALLILYFSSLGGK